jgi:hypothetical protein
VTSPSVPGDATYWSLTADPEDDRALSLLSSSFLIFCAVFLLRFVTLSTLLQAAYILSSLASSNKLERILRSLSTESTPPETTKLYTLYL